MPSTASDDIDILEKAKRLLAPDYVPSEDEEYMNDRQQAYFRMLLIEWKIKQSLNEKTFCLNTLA